MARMAGASVTKTAQLAHVSAGIVTKVTSEFRSMGQTSVNWTGHYGRQHEFDKHFLLLRYCDMKGKDQLR